MTAAPTPKHEGNWSAFAAEVGIELANPPGVEGSYGKLDVLSAEWLAPEGDMPAVIELRVKTRTGRVLNFDMVLEYDCISDATADYDEVDGELVEHEYDLTKPQDVARMFGEQRC